MMKGESRWNRKGLAIGIILLFVGTSVVQLTAEDTKKSSLPLDAPSNNDLCLNNSENNVKSEDMMDYYAGDMDTPLFNISVIMNKSMCRLHGD